MKIIVTVVCLISLCACSSSQALLTDRIIGQWNMEQVMVDKLSDVSSEHNPEGNRFVIFNANNTFESGGDPYGRNTGKWTLDEETGELYLDSDAGEADDSHWIISFYGDEMYWQGTRGAFNSRFQIVHTREK